MLTNLIMALALASQPAQVEIEAPGPEGPLRGVMSGPRSPDAPLVLVVPGSGPTDRNGDNPLGVRAATYRLLGDALAAEGVTTARIDKRGMFGSQGAAADANAVTIPDYADDVRNWISVLRESTGVECVWLLGHSEGGLISLVAAQNPEGICGLILVAAPGRPAGEIMREQLRANPANAPLLDQALAALDRLEAGQTVDTTDMHPALMPLFAPQVQNAVRSLLSYDPAELVSGYAGPVLILQGRRDIQVSEGDALALARASERAWLALLPEVNHVLKSVASDDRQANVETYMDPDLPLASSVAATITTFLRATQ